MIFQISSQNKNKKREKQLPPQPQTAQGAYVNHFISLRRLDGRFHCPRRKDRFCPKLRETKRIFSFLKQQVPKHFIQFRFCTLLSPVIFHPRHVFMVNRSTDVMVFPFNYRPTSLWRIVELWQR